MNNTKLRSIIFILFYFIFSHEWYLTIHDDPKEEDT